MGKRGQSDSTGAHPRGLAALCLALAVKGWSHADLAGPIGMETESVRKWGTGTRPHRPNVQNALHHLGLPEAVFELCESMMEDLTEVIEAVFRQRRAEPSAAPELRSAGDESDESLVGAGELREPSTGPLLLPGSDAGRRRRAAEHFRAIARHHQEIFKINMLLSIDAGLPIEAPSLSESNDNSPDDED